jgi:hypothetical protein
MVEAANENKKGCGRLDLCFNELRGILGCIGRV